MPISEQITQYVPQQLGFELINNFTGDKFYPLNGFDTRHFDRAVTVSLVVLEYVAGDYVLSLQHSDVGQAASFVDVPAIANVHPDGLQSSASSIVVSSVNVFARLAPYSTLNFIRAKVSISGVGATDNFISIAADKWPDTRPKS